MKIAVDFDGTVVDHRYPTIGKEVPYAVSVLKSLIKEGHQIILFTMRSGYTLGDAIKWFGERGISLYGIQWDPTQHKWTQSNKCYADVYIDDAALGCPLIQVEGFNRPCVDWTKIREMIKQLEVSGIYIQS